MSVDNFDTPQNMTFSLFPAASFTTVYGINTGHQIVPLGNIVGASNLTVPLSSVGDIQDAFAFDGTHYSNVVSLRNTAGIPDAPANLTAEASYGAGSARVALTWDNSSDDESGYLVEREDLTAASGWAPLVTLGADVTTFTDSSVNASHQYNYRVIALNLDGYNAYSSDPSKVAFVWFSPLVSTPMVNPLVATVGDELTFSAKGLPETDTDNPLTYSWTLTAPDLSTVTLSGNTYTPSQVGIWTANLTVTDTINDLSTTVGTKFTVGPSAPLAIDGPTVGVEGQLVSFSALGTGADQAEWSAIFGNNVVATGCGTTFSFAPGAGGAYQIQATYTDGVAHSAVSNLTVTHVAPTITISGAPVGFQGRSMTFAANVNQSQLGSDALAYQWAILNADGSSAGISATSNLSTCVVPGSLATGSYQVRLTVTDSHDSISDNIVKSFGFTVLADPSSSSFKWGTAPLTAVSPNLMAYVTAVIQQPDGKIVVAASSIPDDANSMVLIRFNKDLSLDTTFGPSHSGMLTGAWTYQGGTLGVATPKVGDPGMEILAFGINPVDQDIVAVGNVWSSSLVPYLTVAEFTMSDRIDSEGNVVQAGVYDPDFNGGFPKIFAYGGTSGIGDNVHVFNNGSMLIEGDVMTWGAPVVGVGSFPVSDFTLIKLDRRGNFDKTFNGTGVAEAPYVSGWESDTPFVDSDSGTPCQWGLDLSEGFVHQASNSMIVFDSGDENGKIEIAGLTTKAATGEIAHDGSFGFGPTGLEFVRYNSDGTLDTSFGSDNSGEVFTAGGLFAQTGNTPLPGTIRLGGIEPIGNQTLAIAVEADGTAGNQVSLLRYNENGSLDLSYGIGGVQPTSLKISIGVNLGANPAVGSGNSGYEFFGAYAYESDGTIVTSLLTDSGWTIESINATTGAVDAQFGTPAGSHNNSIGPIQDATGREDFDLAPQFGNTLLLNSDSSMDVIGGGILDASDQNSVFPPTWTSANSPCAPWIVPAVVRYTVTPAPAASNLEASILPNHTIELTWDNTGKGQDGFLIERSTSPGGLGTSGSLIATVGADQTEFIDASTGPDVQYFYQVVPFSTDVSGNQQLANATNIASIHSLPKGTNNVLVETVNVPSSGTVVTSNTTLAAGKTYILVVSGSIALANGTLGDGAYWYEINDLKSYGTAIAIDQLKPGGGDALVSTPYGIGLQQGASGTMQIPSWGAYDPATHTYTYVIVGADEPLSLALQDSGFTGATGFPATQLLQVAIFAVNPTSATLPTGTAPIMHIAPLVPPSQPAPVIQTNTPVSILATNPDGTTAVAWTLNLVSSTGKSYTLASSSQSVGALPSSTAQVAEINPAMYPNGLYTLQLEDHNGTVVDQQPLSIVTAVKTGAFVLPITDAIMQTIVGNITITRTYDSSRIDQVNDFGPGWSFDLLNTHLMTTARADTFDTSSTLPALRAGDLIYLTVPNDGAHVFEFVPVPIHATMSFAGSSSAVEYAPTFVAIDGSGATLTVPPDPAGDLPNPLIYDAKDNEYLPVMDHYDTFPFAFPYGVSNSDIGSALSGFNPAKTMYGGHYQLTTKDGTSYIINGSTGRIESVSNPSGQKITYTVGSTTILATTGVGSSTKTIFTIQTNENGQIALIQVPGQPEITYQYNSDAELASVENMSGVKTFYEYEDLYHPNFLSTAWNAQGLVVLQAQYNIFGQLSSIMTAQGGLLPVSSTTLSANEVAQTVVDPAGDVTQDVYDERYGTLLRKIQTVEDPTNPANVSDYIVTVTDFTYVTDQLGQVSATWSADVQMLQSVKTYASFEIAGTDAAGLRYSQQPDANSWTQLVTFDTSDNRDDAASGMPVTLSKQLVAGGAIQTTIFSCYTVTNATLQLVKPQILITEMQTPGYNTQIQNVAYTTYDIYGREIDSLKAIPSSLTIGAATPASGTHNSYDSQPGELSSTQVYSANITLTFDGVNASVSVANLPLSNNTTFNGYYDYSDDTPGALWGAAKYSIDAAGQETYYAFDSMGHVLLKYVYKVWSDSYGNPVYGWVGTTNVYNSTGLLTDTYQATYLDKSRNLDGYGHHILQVVSGGPAGIQVDEVTYSSPIRTVHNDYDTLNQKTDSIDQFGGTTSYTYDANGNLIRTVYPNGTETRSVYDALNRVVWTTTQPFMPASGDPSNATSTAILTHTIYNQLGQVIETDQWQGGAITISSTHAGSSLVWLSQEVGGTRLSYTQTFYDPQGNAIETISTADQGALLRTGTIYNPDGSVAYTGPLTTSASDIMTGQAVNGITNGDFTPTDFASYTHTLYNQFKATLYAQSNGAVGFYTAVIDPNGHETDTYKDSQGRTVRVVYDDGSFTETLYSFGDQPVSIDQEGETINNPDSGWNGIPDGGYEVVQIAQREPGDSPIVTYYLYDAAGRLTDVWQPAVADEDPNSPTYYPTYGQLVEPHTHYIYDTAGNETDQIDAREWPDYQNWLLGGGNYDGNHPFTNETAFAYDQFGNQIKQTLAGGETQSWTYNALGQVLTHVDGMLQTTVYTYDNSPSGQGRPTAKYYFTASVNPFNGNGTVNTSAASQATVTSYNALSLPSEMDDYVNGTISRTTTYTYDPIFQQANTTTSPEGTIQYLYNSIGQHIETRTSNTDTSYHYDTQGRLSTVTVTELNGQTLATPLVTTYHYDPAGNKTQEIQSSGTTTIYTTTYTYDHLNRLTDVVEAKGTQTIFSQHYLLNSDGTRSTSTESVLQPDGSTETINTTWLYDGLDRLTDETVTSSFGTGLMPANNLPTSITLPANSDYLNFSSDGGASDVTLNWNGTEYATAQLPVPWSQGGAMLVSPIAGVTYGGNGSDWVLVTVNDYGETWSWTMTLYNGTFIPDGVNESSSTDQAITGPLDAGDYSDHYTYDLASNRLEKRHAGPGGGQSDITDYQYNADDEVVSQSSGLSGTTTFKYDDNGSLKKQVSEQPQYKVGLDTTFGISGTTAILNDSAWITAEAVLPNGDILAVGSVDSTILRVEFKPDGSIDPGFGAYVYGVNGLGMNYNGTLHANALAVAADGTFFVTGSASDSSGSHIFIAKFRSNGAMFTSFGTSGNGIVILPGVSQAMGDAISLLPNGDILVAGTTFQSDGVLAEFIANGTLDPTFSGGGVVTITSRNTSAGASGWNALSVLPNGNILVSGGGRLAEYSSIGQLVPGYGSNGIALTSYFSVYGMTVLADGEVLLLEGSPFNSSTLAVEKFYANGTREAAFATSGGLALVPWNADGTGAQAVLSLPSGEILVAGSGTDSSGYQDLLLAEFKADGTVDTGFGSGGVVLTPLNTWAQATGITLLADGEVLVTGQINAYYRQAGFLAKYQVSGSPESYDSSSTQETDYTYDVRNKLIEVSDNGSVEASYVYDIFGNRVQETVGGVTTLYLTDTQNPTGYDKPIEERNSAGQPIVTFILGDRVLGQVDTAGNVTYLLSDGHGSTRILMSAAGAVTAAFNYDAFGTALNFNAGMAATPFLFGGDSMFDAPSGLDFHGTGRQRLGFFFIESDAQGYSTNSDPISLHHYVYTNADPTNLADPTGWFTQQFGYAVEREVQRIYLLDHPSDDPTLISFGQWTRVPLTSLFKLKPDILNRNPGNKHWLEIKPLTPTGLAEAEFAKTKYLPLLLFGYTPEITYEPSQEIIYPNGVPTGIFQFDGIIYYTDLGELAGQSLLIALLRQAMAEGGGQAISRSLVPALANVANKIRVAVKVVPAAEEADSEDGTAISGELAIYSGGL